MRLFRSKRLDNIRLIFFSNSNTEIRQFEFRLGRVLGILLVSALIVGAVFLVSLTVVNHLYETSSNNALARSNDFLMRKIKNLSSTIENLGEKVNLLEGDTEDLELLVGLREADEDWSSEDSNFLSGHELVMASVPIDYEYRVDKMSDYLDILEIRVKKAIDTQEVIEDKFLETQNEIRHIPSIRPVQGGRITDRFGERIDPFIERTKHHGGVDLSARYGTSIYSAASGVVEFTRVRYRLNKGYGKVVILNHGYGYKTLYGHLSKILVKRGQKVNRWDVIGLAGDTGRATGPHLHYEVSQNGHAKNPEDFILN